MPPLKTYVFKNKVHPAVTTIVEIYGDEQQAMRVLSTVVQNTNEWVLTSIPV